MSPARDVLCSDWTISTCKFASERNSTNQQVVGTNCIGVFSLDQSRKTNQSVSNDTSYAMKIDFVCNGFTNSDTFVEIFKIVTTLYG